MTRGCLKGLAGCFTLFSLCILTLLVGCPARAHYLSEQRVDAADEFDTAGQTDQALAAYAEALQYDSRNPRAYLNRAVCYQQIGEREKSLADVTAAIELKPKKSVLSLCYGLRGDLLMDAEDMAGALRDYTHRIELDPQSTKAYSDRGILHGKMGEFEKALADDNRSVELSPQNALCYNNRGTDYRSLGRLPEALADLDKAIALDKRDPLYYLNRAEIQGELKNIRAAEADFAEAIKLEGGRTRPWFRRARYYVSRGSYDLAIKDCERGLKLNSKDGWLYLVRGDAYAGLGNTKQAEANYIVALSTGSLEKIRKQARERLSRLKTRP